jgi:hypothetical protein
MPAKRKDLTPLQQAELQLKATRRLLAAKKLSTLPFLHNQSWLKKHYEFFSTCALTLLFFARSFAKSM